MSEHPERIKDLRKVHNTLERRAHLIVDLLEDRAEHIVDSMDEPPPGTEEPDAATVRAMWSFSPYGPVAPQAFWALHDATLEKLLQALAAQPLPGDQRMKALRAAHQQAEAIALERIYPHRANLILLGITTPERSVKLAERAQRLVEQEDKRPPRPEAEPEEALYA